MAKLKIFTAYLLLLLFMVIGESFGQSGRDDVLSKEKLKAGWKFLFDGKTFKGWRCAGSDQFPFWSIKDGLLSVNDTAKVHGGFDLISDSEYGDFDLTLDYSIATAGNSGIKYTYARYQSGGELGLEFQLLDDQFASDNKQANHLCGSLYDIYEPNAGIKKLYPPGKWNHVRIFSRGNHVEHWLNQIKILEYEKGSPSYIDAVKKSKYQTEPMFGTMKKGKIMLQDHGAKVSFRNIMIKEL